jgi:hypothetical protein
MGRAGLERAYSPKVWLAMRSGLRGRYTYRSFAHSALVSFTPGGKLPIPEQMNLSPAMFLYRYSISSEHNGGRRKWEAMMRIPLRTAELDRRVQVTATKS